MKKFLSLVLALVMTMSLVTISAGAKDFTDDSKITYAEAVDVISAVKVVDGYTDGSFNPTATLTRGAAAKIICNLILGPTTASALVADAATFKDVPADSTFAGYIAYCAKEGIISGYADGTFKPGATLTTYAYMKMLLGALGYDKAVEGYDGANWSINVAKRALNIGLDKGLVDDLNGVKPVTREEACLYALNTLKATMVEYDSTIIVGDITIAGSKAQEVANTGKTDGYIKNDDKMQFAEKYFTNLKNFGDTDAFERPATTWTLKSKNIGTYADEADETYTAAVKVGTIYSDPGLTKGIPDENTTVYVDGAKQTSGWTDFDIVKGDISNKIGGNGAVTDIYYDADDNTLTVVVVNTYVAKIAAVRPETTTMDAYVVLNTGDSFTKPAGVSTVGNFETDEFAKDDIVRYTYSKKSGEACIETMALAEKVTGAMSGYTTTGSVTVSGTKYDGNTVSAANIAAFSATVDKGSDVTVYLDEYGYGLYIDADTSAEYAVVLDYAGSTGDFGDVEKAKLLLTDGTTVTVEVDTTGINTGSYATTPVADKLSKYDIVSYTIDSDKVYDLALVADAQTGNAGGAFVLNNGANTFSLTSGNKANLDASGKVTHYSDGKTIFLVADTTNPAKPTYSVYEGIANVPTIKHNGGVAGLVTVFMNSTTNNTPAKVVFVEKNAQMSMTTDNKDVIFIKGSSVGSSYTTALGTYWEYDAFLNGEETTIKTTTAVTVDTLVYGPAYNAKDLLVLANCEQYVNSITAPVDHTSTADMKYVVGTDSVVNDVVKLGTPGSTQVPYAYTTDVNVYYITVDGKLVPSDITAIAEDSDDIVFLKTNDKGRLTDVYVRIVDAPDTIGPVAPPSIGFGGVSGMDGVIAVVASSNAIVRAEVLAQEDGVYQVDSADDGVAAALGSAADADEHLVFFKVTNQDDGAGYRLNIRNSAGQLVYTETYAGPYAVGPVLCYVNIAPASDSDANSGEGSMKTTDLTAGTYSYTFSCGNNSVTGTFTVE